MLTETPGRVGASFALSAGSARLRYVICAQLVREPGVQRPLISWLCALATWVNALAGLRTDEAALVAIG